MKVLVDDRWFGETGIGRYAREILQRKPERHSVACLNRGWRISNPVTPWLLGAAANRGGADLFWSPGFMPPALCRIPYVVTVHDLIHLHYGSARHRFYYDQVIRRLLSGAASVLTVSEHSREEILEWSGLEADRVRAVPLAASPAFSAGTERFEPGYPYILYVGNRRVYKNLHRLIRAFAAGCRDTGIRLALSGDPDRDLLDLIGRLGLGERVVFLGRIAEEALPAVYRGALALAYVSLYEGFGLPPLEAMACGTPVLASNVTSLPEVVGDAGLLVDPLDVEEIAHGLSRLTEDGALRSELVRRGQERVRRRFNWEVCATSTWEVLRQAAQA